VTPACHVPREAGGWEGQRNMEILTREPKDHPAQARKCPETGGVDFLLVLRDPQVFFTRKCQGVMFVNS